MMSVVAPIAAAVGLIVAFCLTSWIGKADEGTDRMKEIAGFIREGAMPYCACSEDSDHRPGLQRCCTFSALCGLFWPDSSA